MPKFKVWFRQKVIETAAVEIEAETAEAAAVVAQRQYNAGELDLSWDGVDTSDTGVNEVCDLADSPILDDSDCDDAIMEAGL